MSENNSLQKKSIPFIEILKRAIRMVWTNRFLLWFGFLMALGSPGSFSVGNNEDLEGRGEVARSFLEAHWQIALLFALILFAVGIVLFLVSLAAKAGLVKSAREISQNKKTDFKSGWVFGKKYIGRLLALSLIFFFATFVIVVVLAVPIIYLVIAQSWIAAVLVGLFAVAIFIPLMFVFALTKNFAEFYIVLSGLKVRDAIESGYELLLGNIVNSIIFSLLLFVLGLAAGLILLPVAGIALVILVPTGIAFFYLNKIMFAVFLVFAIFVFLVVILLVSSVFHTVRTVAWTLFFQEIAKIEKMQEETITESEEKPIAVTPIPPATTQDLE